MQEIQLSMKALIVRNHKFLIVFDANDEKWELPGGKVKFGEDPNETLPREIKEELGADIIVGDFVGMCYLFHKGKQTIINVFRCIPSHFNFNLSKNPSEEKLERIKFVSKKEFLSDEYPVYHESLKDLIKKQKFNPL